LFFVSFLALFVATYAWPTQVGACGSPIFYDSFNGTANQHTSEFPSNGSWVLSGVPTTWYPSTQYTITINGTNAGINATKNCRVRGFLLAAYDAQGVAYGTWSDVLGYTQTKTCGQDDVEAVPNPNYGTPGFKVSSGTVGSHTGVIGNTVKVYQLLSVIWTSPPVAASLSFGGVIVSDKIYNSLLPVYATVGVQGTFPLPTVSSAVASSAAAGTSASTPATQTTGSATSVTVSFFLGLLLIALL